MHWFCILPVVAATVVAGACTRENPEHCHNRSADASCATDTPELPYCNRCVAEHNGCVAAPIEDPECRSGEASGTAGTDATSGATAEVTTEPTSVGTETGGSGTGTDTEPPVVCGDDVVSGDEQCDSDTGESCAEVNLGQGIRQCVECMYDDSMCQLEPMCGNGTREGTEECDGADMPFANCADLPGGAFYAGSLSCNECMLDATECVPCKTATESCETAAACCGDLECRGIAGALKTCQAP